MIREIVCGLNYMYGVDNILGIEVRLPRTYMLNAEALAVKCYRLSI